MGGEESGGKESEILFQMFDLLHNYTEKKTLIFYLNSFSFKC